MIQAHYEKVKKACGEQARLCVVSKKRSKEEIMSYYDAGERIFGENHAQELEEKYDAGAYLGKPGHFIGHLQTNKLKMVLPYVALVQSVDSLHLVEAIERWGSQNGKVTDILLECHVSSDQSKQGFSNEELLDFLSSGTEYPHVHVRGVMGMATLTDDEEVIRDDFRRLAGKYDLLHDWIGESPNLPHAGQLEKENSQWDVSEISMGMSDDYRIAVEEGSTMVRIGSMIFGARQY